MISNKKYLRIAIVLLPALVFIASLTQKAFSYQYIEVEVTDGLLLLLMGGIAWIGGGLCESVIWLANPIALIAIIRFLRESSTMVKTDYVLKNVVASPKLSSYWISALAASIAWSFSLWNEVLAAESGSMGEILSLEPGYWLWASSFTLLAIGINYYHLQSKLHNSTEQRHDSIVIATEVVKITGQLSRKSNFACFLIKDKGKYISADFIIDSAIPLKEELPKDFPLMEPVLKRSKFFNTKTGSFRNNL